MQDQLWQQLLPLARAESPFGDTGPQGRATYWVEPRLVCEVRFTEWTADGGLRHPIFIGMRTDRKPEEIRREVEDSDVASEADAAAAAAIAEGLDAAGAASVSPAPGGPSAAPDAEPRVVRLSNLRKVFWPDEGYTKGDLIAYYETVAPLMLPYLRDRPVV